MSAPTSPATTSLVNTTYPMHLEPGTLNGQPITGGWQAENALAREIVADFDPAGLDYQAWTTVISALRTNLPIVVTVAESNERTRTFTAMVEYATVDRDGRSSKLRLRSWGGFSTYYYTSEILAVATPEVIYG